MRFKVAEAGFVVFLLSSSVVLGQIDHGVTYSSTQICAVEGSTVEISCSYTYPSRINDNVTVVEKAVWFTKMEGGEPVNLMTDAEFSGRVQYHCDENKCTLRISDLRERDSAEYKFRFTTNQPGGKYTGSPGVTLTVSVLHVEAKKTSPILYPRWAEVKCQSRCRLSARSYVWYKNGVNMNKDTDSIEQYFDYGDSVSCAVKGSEKFPSPPQCSVYRTCNKVTYTDRSICAIEGSSVNISCTYSHHDYYDDVVSKFWFSPDCSRQWMNRSQPEDLSKDSQYSGRVQVLEPETGRSTLRITNLTESDSSEYHFKFKTRLFEWRSVLPGTTLTVTALQVQVTRIISVHQSQTEAELKCLSSCSPVGRLYVWFKNQQRIRTQQTSTLTDNFSPGDTVSCAFSGHEDYRSPSIYPSKLSPVSVNSSGEIVEGSSVTVTCRIDANPAANYTWYKGNQPLPLGPGGIYHFTSISSEDRGIYYCKSEDQHSVSVFIDVQYPPKLPSVSVSPSGEIVEGSSVTLTCSSDANPAANYTWYKENEDSPKASGQIFTITEFKAEHRGSYYCDAQNRIGRHNSTLHLIVIVGKLPVILNVIRLTLVVLVLIPLLLFILGMRKKKLFSCGTEPNEPVEDIEMQQNLRHDSSNSK
ncbi:B-cell receptor CD22-like isoform X1 [Mugil cephalus]|uniref:B-cell receptor CD22-like isoform X1 n=2 Tax=Mugil cephalus TaxID=48193 RepID=UPI001FB69640|nr:B-cell receptor CD22-like isoform X1 [Mugil cephalus]